jgi:hypothetical protein
MRFFSSLALLAASCQSLQAAEPNETFGTSTVLPAGVMTVVDHLTAGSHPDTLLGAKDMFGAIYTYDDDSSDLGDGRASKLEFVATNSGTISFAVTGYPDEFFEGGHPEAGDYEVFVDVYDSFGDLVDSFSEISILQPGVVDHFNYSDFEWINGDYDVYIDNAINPALRGDIDFFTFTGLTPGASFAMQTTDPEAIGIDTYLGWFDAAGSLMAENDDIAEENVLSLIEGVVPGNGSLTFAATGYHDLEFVGDHEAEGAYGLQLSLSGLLSPADFNGDTFVDGDDLDAWAAAFGSGSGGDADDDVDSDGADFLIWQRELSPSMAAAIPEPTSLYLAGCFAASALLRARAPLLALRARGRLTCVERFP